MSDIEIIAVGRMKRSPLLPVWEEYLKRLRNKPEIHEIRTGNKDEENRAVLEKLQQNAFVVVLDEQGRSLKSSDFSKKLENIFISGRNLQFVIGGADGLNRAVRERADLSLSFGNQTWPHLLVRVMLIEQIYRAQQIQSGHPYHRE